MLEQDFRLLTVQKRIGNEVKKNTKPPAKIGGGFSIDKYFGVCIICLEVQFMYRESQFSGMEMGALSKALTVPTATVQTGKQREVIPWGELAKLSPAEVILELCKGFTEEDGFQKVMGKVQDCVRGVSCEVTHCGQGSLLTLEVWGGDNTSFIRFVTARSPEIGDKIEIQVDGESPVYDGEGHLAKIRQTLREIRMDHQMVY